MSQIPWVSQNVDDIWDLFQLIIVVCGTIDMVTLRTIFIIRGDDGLIWGKYSIVILTQTGYNRIGKVG